MKAITIWQPWASLLVAGAKPWTFRKRRPPDRYIGAEVALHAAAIQPPLVALAELAYALEYDPHSTGLLPQLALPLIAGWIRDPASLPRAVVLATARLDEPQRAAGKPGVYFETGRTDLSMWALSFGDIRRLDPPVLARGAGKPWDWCPPASAQAGPGVPGTASTRGTR